MKFFGALNFGFLLASTGDVLNYWLSFEYLRPVVFTNLLRLRKKCRAKISCFTVSAVCLWQNDVQMAVCLLLCLGDKYIHLIDHQLLQQWFGSYVGMCRISSTCHRHFVTIK